MWECVTSTPIHINQADGSSCGNSEKIRNSTCGTISAHCLICAISCLVHLPHICVLMRFLQNQPSNLIAALQTMAAQSESHKQMESIPRLDGTNYHQWSFHITAGLRTLDLWLVTEAVAPCTKRILSPLMPPLQLWKSA